MGQRENPRDKEGTEALVGSAIAAVAFVVTVVGFVWLMVYLWSLPPYRAPDYTVSITGVDGLSQEAMMRSGGGGVPATTTLSPVFNLTVRIQNYNSNHMYRSPCVRGLSTAAVSYGDAVLGQGSVPPFCAEDKEVQERAATAWGEAVVLPRFLRERLSGELRRGEAALDVQVTMPAECFRCEGKVLVCSKVKIGGVFSSPCRVEEVYVRPAPAAGGSTSYLVPGTCADTS